MVDCVCVGCCLSLFGLSWYREWIGCKSWYGFCEICLFDCVLWRFLWIMYCSFLFFLWMLIVCCWKVCLSWLLMVRFRVGNLIRLIMRFMCVCWVFMVWIVNRLFEWFFGFCVFWLMVVICCGVLVILVLIGIDCWLVFVFFVLLISLVGGMRGCLVCVGSGWRCLVVLLVWIVCWMWYWLGVCCGWCGCCCGGLFRCCNLYRIWCRWLLVLEWIVWRLCFMGWVGWRWIVLLILCLMCLDWGSLGFFGFLGSWVGLILLVC